MTTRNRLQVIFYVTQAAGELHKSYLIFLPWTADNIWLCIKDTRASELLTMCFYNIYSY